MCYDPLRFIPWFVDLVFPIFVQSMLLATRRQSHQVPDRRPRCVRAVCVCVCVFVFVFVCVWWGVALALRSVEVLPHGLSIWFFLSSFSLCCWPRAGSRTKSRIDDLDVSGQCVCVCVCLCLCLCVCGGGWPLRYDPLRFYPMVCRFGFSYLRSVYAAGHAQASPSRSVAMRPAMCPCIFLCHEPPLLAGRWENAGRTPWRGLCVSLW